MADPTNPIPQVVAAHGPYEDAIIEGFRVIEKLIDGQSPQQKVEIWQGWIDFWKSPFGIHIGK